MKILIGHFRVGRADGVSLEIDAWKKILIGMGHEVKLMGGNQSLGADYAVDRLEYTGEEYDGNREKFEKTENELQRGFERVVNDFRPDRVIISNIFSVGLNPAAAGALAKALAGKNIKTVGVHHDFYWESIRYIRPVDSYINTYMSTYFPPIGTWIKHVCINKTAAEEFKKRVGEAASVLYDTFDFDLQTDDSDRRVEKLVRQAGVTGDDLVVLQATRIVRRKNIELAIDLAAELQKRLKQRVVLMLAHEPEDGSRDYWKKLNQKAEETSVHMVSIKGLNGASDFLKIYQYADLVTYPSQFEGFGNQFLEAVWAKLPIVVWEYPVYKTDIKPLGFEIVSLGDKIEPQGKSGLYQVQGKVLENAAARVAELLNHPEEKQKMTLRNFDIGKANFSFEQTAKEWKRLL